MKFKIRFADQIVGIFSIAALAGLIIFIFAIGASQNWFVKKNNYYTIFDSGSGFSTGMDLTYKGFSIGKVKSVTLKDGMVRVDYYVLADYASYVHENSLVELITSPIGLGSSFVLHPGKSENLLADGSEIYRLDSGFARDLIKDKKVYIESQTDSIGVLMNKVSLIMDNVNRLLFLVNDALSGKSDSNISSTVKEIIGNVNSITDNLTDFSGNLTDISKNLSNISGSQNGVVPELLGSELSSNINSLMENLSSVTTDLQGISGNVNGLVNQLSPEVMTILLQLNSALIQAQDVLTGVKNNPLIRGGVPDRSKGSSSTAQIRETEF